MSTAPTVDDFFKIMSDQRRPLTKKTCFVYLTGWRSKNKKLDRYNDYISACHYEYGYYSFKVWKVTTLPGEYYLAQKLLNKKGAAILAPGYYENCWQIGLHKGKYPALVQVGPVKVYRDKNLDKNFDMKPDTLEKGLFGINFHKASGLREFIGNNSAGCQVFQKEEDFKSFMSICDLHKMMWGNRFSYNLLDWE